MFFDELVERILNVPAYTAEDLGAHRLRERGSRKSDDEVVSVILVNAKHRNIIAAALMAFVEK
jgi:hypothetical protein